MKIKTNNHVIQTEAKDHVELLTNSALSQQYSEIPRLSIHNLWMTKSVL